jgi:uncharacterized membrane protein YjjB (DUF3815 family)
MYVFGMMLFEMAADLSIGSAIASVAAGALDLSILFYSLAAFFSCVGFSIVFNLKGWNIVYASIGGAIGWAVYLVTPALGGELLRFFVATVAITVYAEVMARLCKTPVTAYLVVSLLPLVPGGGIYYTMRYFINGETQLFIETGLNTLAIAGALAVGILPVFSLVRLYRRIRSQHRGKNKLEV